MNLSNNLNDNFFTTQISVERVRPNTTGKLSKLHQLEQSTDAYGRIKQIKMQLKKADEQYRQALSASKKTRASIDRTNRNTQITRVNFLKVYQTKKLRMMEKNLVQDYKERQKLHHQECIERARKIKLETELQALLLKNQEQENLQKIRQKNRKQKQSLKQQKRLKQSQIEQHAKRQYLSIKNAHTELLVRRKKVESMLQARARHNYMTKINKEIQMLQNYNSLAKQIGELKVLQEQKNQRPMSKSFFITRD